MTIHKNKMLGQTNSNDTLTQLYSPENGMVKR